MDKWLIIFKNKIIKFDTYEQRIGDIWCLTARYDFPSTFTLDFKTLRFLKANGCFMYK